MGDRIEAFKNAEEAHGDGLTYQASMGGLSFRMLSKTLDF
jgi:hypothetical protein